MALCPPLLSCPPRLPRLRQRLLPQLHGLLPHLGEQGTSLRHAAPSTPPAAGPRHPAFCLVLFMQARAADMVPPSPPPPTLPGHLQEVSYPLPSPRARGEWHGRPQLHGSQRQRALGRLRGPAAPRAGRLHPQLLHPQLPGRASGAAAGGARPGAGCPCPALSLPPAPPRRRPTPSPSWPSPSCATPRCCPSTRS